jgi:general secretion pathway protein G
MRSRIPSSLQRGFTLIEILIVVVILGILAAIVIPQFTNASQEAQTSSVQSQLQTVRGQVELFQIQNPNHDGGLPANQGYPDFGANGWTEMLDPALNQAGTRYLQQEPRNAMRNNNTTIAAPGGAVPPAASGAADLTAVGAINDGMGWYWNNVENIMYAIGADGNLVAW